MHAPASALPAAQQSPLRRPRRRLRGASTEGGECRDPSPSARGAPRAPASPGAPPRPRAGPGRHLRRRESERGVTRPGGLQAARGHAAGGGGRKGEPGSQDSPAPAAPLRSLPGVPRPHPGHADQHVRRYVCVCLCVRACSRALAGLRGA
ncbi:uncharacterized protein LOC144581681 [Callithrix jacchus]